MKRQHIPLYAAALGLLIVGALAAGVPASTLLVLALVLACPAMMLFMHMGHGHAAYDEHAGHRGHDHATSAGAVTKSGEVVDAAVARKDVWGDPRR